MILTVVQVSALKMVSSGQFTGQEFFRPEIRNLISMGLICENDSMELSATRLGERYLSAGEFERRVIEASVEGRFIDAILDGTDDE